ncbi:fatty acid desaturase [Nibricoccus sp. IMCC34717]|uniref:fatty acid desaturase n=1 Tax=Nibricoccus sp. IMCC34717 TaxID=3034021 RepID=UPI00384AADDF
MKTESNSVAITWYRTKLDPALFRKLNTKSDALAFAQTLGYLTLVVATAAATVHFGLAGHWGWFTACLFLNGTVSAFHINAVHELGHGTVFKTKMLNEAFMRVFAFLGWINFHVFNTSHIRHHRYTLHPPDDLEVVLPMRILVRNFFQEGFLDIAGIGRRMREVARLAAERFEGEWEHALYDDAKPVDRRAPARWAKLLIVGHVGIAAGSITLGVWPIAVVVSLTPFVGNWLFFLCNNTQHIGMCDHVSDFRLCCRTFTANRFIEFLYWHMNYHIEHHMYASVPCYRLAALHRAMKHDLPACPNGLTATWKQIAWILHEQAVNPKFQYTPAFPQAGQAAPASSAAAR